MNHSDEGEVVVDSLCPGGTLEITFNTSFECLVGPGGTYSIPYIWEEQVYCDGILLEGLGASGSGVYADTASNCESFNGGGIIEVTGNFASTTIDFISCTECS
jgi:hypothetical protein